MKKWTVEMCYGVGVSIEGVEAETQEEAIEEAKRLMEEDPEEFVDMRELEFESLNFVCEED